MLARVDLLFALLEELVLYHIRHILLKYWRRLHLIFRASRDYRMVLTFWQAGATAFYFGLIRFEVRVSLAFEMLTLLKCRLLAHLLLPLHSRILLIAHFVIQDVVASTRVAAAHCCEIRVLEDVLRVRGLGIWWLHFLLHPLIRRQRSFLLQLIVCYWIVFR